MDDDDQARVTCGSCGAGTAEPTLTWSVETTARGRRWLCPTCTRTNLRSIEGRLDEAWW